MRFTKLCDYGIISRSVSVSGDIDPDNTTVVYVNFFRALTCGYVEIVSIPMSPDPSTHTFSFSADLPLGLYDVVATGEGFVPTLKVQMNLVLPGDEIEVTLNL